MAENALRPNERLTVEHLDYFRNFLFDESQTVHSRVELNVDRVVGNAPAARLFDHLLEHLEAIDLRFEPISEQCAVIDNLRIQNHYRHCYAVLAQVDPFVVSGDSEVGRSLGLHRAGNLIVAGSVAERFDHRNYSGFGL